MTYNRFLELFLRKKSGELTSKEQEELEELLKENPGYHELSGVVDQLYDTPLDKVKELSEGYVQDRWARLKDRIREDAEMNEALVHSAGNTSAAVKIN